MMSIKRYYTEGRIVEDLSGPLVLFDAHLAEVSRLQTAFRALTAERDGLAAINRTAAQEVTTIREENERLKGLLREWSEWVDMPLSEKFEAITKRTKEELGQ